MARLCGVLDYYWLVPEEETLIGADIEIGANNSAWTAGSTMLALGLSVPQAMGVIVGSSLIISMIAVVAGWMGSHDHLGFTVMSRA